MYFLAFTYWVHCDNVLYFFLQVDDRGKYPAVDQTTPSSRHQVNLDIIILIYHDRQFLLIYFLCTLLLQRLRNVVYLSVADREFSL